MSSLGSALIGFHIFLNYLCLADKQDRRIEELTILLGQYRKMREVMALAQGMNPILSQIFYPYILER